MCVYWDCATIDYDLLNALSTGEKCKARVYGAKCGPLLNRRRRGLQFEQKDCDKHELLQNPRRRPRRYSNVCSIHARGYQSTQTLGGYHKRDDDPQEGTDSVLGQFDDGIGSQLLSDSNASTIPLGPSTYELESLFQGEQSLASEDFYTPPVPSSSFEATGYHPARLDSPSPLIIDPPSYGQRPTINERLEELTQWNPPAPLTDAEWLATDPDMRSFSTKTQGEDIFSFLDTYQKPVPSSMASMIARAELERNVELTESCSDMTVVAAELHRSYGPGLQDPLASGISDPFTLGMRRPARPVSYGRKSFENV